MKKDSPPGKTDNETSDHYPWMLRHRMNAREQRRISNLQWKMLETFGDPPRTLLHSDGTQNFFQSWVKKLEFLSQKTWCFLTIFQQISNALGWEKTIQNFRAWRPKEQQTLNAQNPPTKISQQSDETLPRKTGRRAENRPETKTKRNCCRFPATTVFLWPFDPLRQSAREPTKIVNWQRNVAGDLSNGIQFDRDFAGRPCYQKLPNRKPDRTTINEEQKQQRHETTDAPESTPTALCTGKPNSARHVIWSRKLDFPPPEDMNETSQQKTFGGEAAQRLHMKNSNTECSKWTTNSRMGAYQRTNALGVTFRGAQSTEKRPIRDFEQPGRMAPAIAAWRAFWVDFESILLAFCSVFARFLASFWLTSGQLLASFWPASGQVLARFWPAFGQILTNFWIDFRGPPKITKIMYPPFISSENDGFDPSRNGLNPCRFTSIFATPHFGSLFGQVLASFWPGSGQLWVASEPAFFTSWPAFFRFWVDCRVPRWGSDCWMLPESDFDPIFLRKWSFWGANQGATRQPTCCNAHSDSAYRTKPKTSPTMPKKTPPAVVRHRRWGFFFGPPMHFSLFRQILQISSIKLFN